MTALFAYFERVQALIKGLSGVEIERYEEQILSQERGNLRVRLRFTDNALLEISEAIHVKNGTLSWLAYRYHYQKPDGRVIFRYDNAPHHPEVSTHPDHKHKGDEIIGAVRPDIEHILSETGKES
jgi:hypothetical protein